MLISITYSISPWTASAAPCVKSNGFKGLRNLLTVVIMLPNCQSSKYNKWVYLCTLLLTLSIITILRRLWASCSLLIIVARLSYFAFSIKTPTAVPDATTPWTIITRSHRFMDERVNSTLDCAMANSVIINENTTRRMRIIDFTWNAPEICDHSHCSSSFLCNIKMFSSEPSSHISAN